MDAVVVFYNPAHRDVEGLAGGGKGRRGFNHLNPLRKRRAWGQRWRRYGGRGDGWGRCRVQRLLHALVDGRPAAVRFGFVNHEAATHPAARTRILRGGRGRPIHVHTLDRVDNDAVAKRRFVRRRDVGEHLVWFVEPKRRVRHDGDRLNTLEAAVHHHPGLVDQGRGGLERDFELHVTALRVDPEPYRHVERVTVHGEHGRHARNLEELVRRVAAVCPELRRVAWRHDSARQSYCEHQSARRKHGRLRRAWHKQAHVKITLGEDVVDEGSTLRRVIAVARHPIWHQRVTRRAGVASGGARWGHPVL